MRRPLLALPILAMMLAPAHAQNGGPDVGALQLPLALRGAIERHAEVGCSQSFQSSVGNAQLSLVIDRGGRARLTLDGDYASTTGPSPGRYMAGDHEFTRLHELHRSTWSGHATLTADEVVVTFDHVTAAEVRFTGDGTLPLPAPTTSAFAGELRCHREPVDVLPAIETAGELPTATSLLRCAWTGEAPDPFDRYADGSDPWAIGSGAGVRNLARNDAWSTGTTHEVRLLP